MRFFKNILLLIFAPGVAWSKISKTRVPQELLLSKLYYPMLAIMSLTVFTAVLYGEKLVMVEYLRKVVAQVALYFFGYMISAMLLTIANKGEADGEDNGKEQILRINCFIIYCYSVMMLFTIIQNLLPVAMVIFDFVPFYMVFVIWKGVNEMTWIKEKVKNFVFYSLCIPGLYCLLKLLFSIIV